LITYEEEHNLAYIKRTAREDGENDGPYSMRIDQKAYLGIPGG
jgi:hypothetical protein